MIRQKAPKLLIPLSPQLPVHDTNATQKWTLQPSFDPSVRSQHRMLRCLRAEIATVSEASLAIILDIKYYEVDSSQNSCVKLLLGHVGVNTSVQAAACGDGTTNVWAAIPGAVIEKGLTVTLQVLSEDLIRDQLTIGILQEASAPTAAQPTTVKKSTLSNPQSFVQTPTATANEKMSEISPKAPDHHDSILPNEELPPEYHRLCLRVTGELDDVMDDWSSLEKKAGRRLVRFWREQDGSLVKLRFATHSPLDPYHEKSQMVISCIGLPDREGLWVTSFDIVRLAEYILHLPLNTDMKNRARRNMASVEYKTLLRVIANEHSKLEAFTAVMQFEDPKPRSIEKSIKIYKWEVLKMCLAKILQRFIIHLSEDQTGPVEFEHQLEAVNRWKRSRRINASSARPLKTRRDVDDSTFVDQDDPKIKRVTRRSQNNDGPKLKKALPRDEPANPRVAPLKQEPQSPGQTSPNVQEGEDEDFTHDQKGPSSSSQIHSPLGVHTTSSPLVVTPLAIDSTPVTLSPAMSIDTTQPGYQRPIHPSLQRGLSSNSLTIVHHGWTVPSHSGNATSVVLPSPTETYASSFDSHSPLQSHSSSPQFLFFADSNSPSQQQYPQNSVSSGSSDGYSPEGSNSGMANSSTVFTPTWSPHPGLYVHTPIEYRSPEVNLIPNFDFNQYSQPGTPGGDPHSPALVRGISVNPHSNYPSYNMERDYMLQLQGLSQGPLAMHQVKEEEKEIDTDEWLDNDYIMSQENNHIG